MPRNIRRSGGVLRRPPTGLNAAPPREAWFVPVRWAHPGPQAGRSGYPHSQNADNSPRARGVLGLASGRSLGGQHEVPLALKCVWARPTCVTWFVSGPPCPLSLPPLLGGLLVASVPYYFPSSVLTLLRPPAPHSSLPVQQWRPRASRSQRVVVHPRLLRS